MGHGFILMEEAFWQPRCNLVASPHISVLVTSSQYLAASLQSGGLATYICSGDFVTISGSLAAIWWLRHIYICSGGLATIFVSGDLVTISGSFAAISVVCSGCMGRVVSPHGVRLVRGCYGWLWVGISAFMIYLFCMCYGPMGFILISILGQGPDKSDSEV